MLQKWTQDDYIQAYRFAADRHHGQKYPGTDLPYVMHLSFVCMEVIVACHHSDVEDETIAIQCALLHDTIEDTSTTYEEIKQEFGVKVADGVLALTKNADLEKSLRMLDSLQRIQQQPRAIGSVKLADRITNLQAPPHYWQPEKIVAYREEAIVIYEHLKLANDYLANRLQQKIEAYQQWIPRSAN
jgi:(p)ppGpp synthase/HD superfamily hydrolase